MKKQQADSSQALIEFSERLGHALDELNVPPKYRGRAKWVAEKFGLSPNGARKWLEARSMPEPPRWPDIAGTLHVRLEWLIFGLGSMRGESDLAPATHDGQACPRDGELLGIVIDAVDSGAPELPREQRLSIASAIYNRLQKL